MMPGRHAAATLAVAMILFLPAVANGATPEVDLKRLATATSNWRVVSSEGDDLQGSQCLENLYWGMYFIHWSPLPDSAPKQPDEQMVMDAIRGIWGDEVSDFKPEKEGKTKIHMHKGYFVQGTRKSGTILSRYTVILCPKSKRLITSQVDIYQSLGTPAELEELLEESEHTLSCHGENRRFNNPKVPRKMNFPGVEISFYIPDNFRSDMYGDDNNRNEGHIWTLPTNAFEKIYYGWFPGGSLSHAEAAARILEGWKATFLVNREGVEMVLMPEGDGTLIPAGEGYTVSGTAEVKDEHFAWDAGKHRYRLRLWKKGETWHGVVYSIASRDSFWDHKVYLAPDDQTFEDLEERLSKAVPGFPSD